MKDILGYIAQSTGAAIALIAATDVLLSDERKATLAEFSIRMWDFVDEFKKKIRRFSAADTLNARVARVVLWICILLVCSYGVYQWSDGAILLVIGYILSDWYRIIPVACVVLAVALVWRWHVLRFMPWVRWRLLHEYSLPAAYPWRIFVEGKITLREVVAIFIFGLAPVVISSIPALLYFSYVNGTGKTPPEIPTVALLLMPPLSFLPFVLGTFAFYAVVVFAVVCSFLLIFCKAIVKVIEVGIRRVAEYPKGPLFAISALLGAAGELVKHL